MNINEWMNKWMKWMNKKKGISTPTIINILIILFKYMQEQYYTILHW